MNTKQLIAGIVGALMLLCTSAMADYSADQPFTQYQRGMTHGDLVYVAAPLDGSAYTNLDATDPTDIMKQILDIGSDIPDGATIITARLYNYVSWSTPDYRDWANPGDPAEAKLTFNGVEVTCQNPPTFTNTIDYGNGAVQYWDTKGQGYGGQYDCPSGTFAWDVTELVVDGVNTAIIANADSSPTVRSDGVPESITTYGFGLLVVYDIEPVGPHPEKSHYWILEGADMLYAKEGHELPEDCKTVGFFGGGVPQFNKPDNAFSADLTTVVVSADKAPLNKVFFNNQYMGDCTLVNDKSIAVDTYPLEIGWELHKTGNFVEIQDLGDYMVPSNAFLVVNYY